jgi:enamine deaminase RidA (YjgF/YER057c/UK114 family)
MLENSMTLDTAHLATQPHQKTLLGCVLFGILVSGIATAADAPVITRQGTPEEPFSSSIWVGDTLYLSGALPPATVPEGAPAGTRPAITGDTRTQTANTLAAIRKTLQTQGLDLKDVVQMHVYLLGDPARGGKMDFAGMNAAYLQFFGTAEQPNKPVRSTVQVAGLAAEGALVEIEVTAVRSRTQ